MLLRLVYLLLNAVMAAVKMLAAYTFKLKGYMRGIDIVDHVQ
tara:strand:+ start:200 stop:325 length:126 start_codon:yes stop_codon:yes gene_type:complete